MEDRNGNTISSGDLAVTTQGVLFRLTNSHFKGITGMNKEWFNELTRVTNVDEMSMEVKATIRLKKGQ